MEINTFAYNTLSDSQKQKFFDFCEDASLEPFQPASKNMFHSDWINQPHTLPYILEKTDRFTDNNGVFHVVTVDGRIAACGGVYISDFDSNVALLGCRTWVHPLNRHQLIPREHLLVLQKAWAIERGASILCLTFNEYNKNLIATFERTRLGENSTRLKEREEKHLFYNNFNTLDYSVIIKNTEQWVAYEKLSDYDCDWSKLV